MIITPKSYAHHETTNYIPYAYFYFHECHSSWRGEKDRYGMIRFNYIPDVDESYKTRLWAIFGAKIFSPVSEMREIGISGSGFPVNKILPIEEYQSIQQLSDDGENHIYLYIYWL